MSPPPHSPRLTENEAARHYLILQGLGKSLSANAPTATINNPDWFTHNSDRKIHPQKSRRVIHKQIISEITSTGQVAKPGAQPIAILLAGPPGSGKSTGFNDVFARNDTAITGGLIPNDFAVIDADAIKSRLLDTARTDGTLESFIKPPAVRDLEARGEVFSDLDLASLVHEESSLIADNARDIAISQRRNVIFDQVCSSPNKTARLVDSLAQAGYSVKVVEIHATREFSLESTFGRYISAATQGTSARRVPTEVVDSVFLPDGASKPRQAIEKLLTTHPTQVSEYRRYDALTLAQPPVLTQTGTRGPDGAMHRRDLPAIAPEQKPLKTKADILATQQQRAQQLISKPNQKQPHRRGHPTL